MDNEEFIELRAIIGGRVQGVGFRATTLYIAKSLDITGTVCNLPDGTVEINAQGRRQAMQTLFNSLKDEFPALKVIKEEYKSPGWLFPDFRITYVRS